MARASKQGRSQGKNQTMTTLQMWQQQMAALQRASQPTESQPISETQEQKSEDQFKSSGLIYPHLP